MRSQDRAPAARFDNIDLLRAFAAIAVVLYHVIEHGNWTGFPHEGPLVTFRIGWLGVNLFFVISGFVIGYSALALYASEPRTFAGNYWRRRLTRILPLYFLTLVLWVVACELAGRPVDRLGPQLVTHSLFIHNFWPGTHGAIDGVNWTLAAEMQFYLLVALLIGWIARTPGWRIWLYGIVVALAWRAMVFTLLSHEGADRLHIYTTQLPGSLDEFGAGIFLAKWLRERPEPRAGEAWVWLAGACVTGYMVMTYYWGHARYWDEAQMVIFWRTPFAIFLVCVVAAAVRLPQAIATTWLRPVAYLGQISYGIYLWHLFAVMFVVHIQGIKGEAALVPVLALTLALAVASWHLLEKPMLSLARRGITGKPVPAEAT